MSQIDIVIQWKNLGLIVSIEQAEESFKRLINTEKNPYIGICKEVEHEILHTGRSSN